MQTEQRERSRVETFGPIVPSSQIIKIKYLVASAAALTMIVGIIVFTEFSHYAYAQQYGGSSTSCNYYWSSACQATNSPRSVVVDPSMTLAAAAFTSSEICNDSVDNNKDGYVDTNCAA
jgi:hypothetical protein